MLVTYVNPLLLRVVRPIQGYAGTCFGCYLHSANYVTYYDREKLTCLGFLPFFELHIEIDLFPITPTISFYYSKCTSLLQYFKSSCPTRLKHNLIRKKSALIALISQFLSR